jgi:SPP1 family phage portal protein
MLKVVDEYPDYSGFISHIRTNGISDDVINKIINKHVHNSRFTKELYDRYKTREDAVPIFSRKPRFEQEGVEELNNKINNDFFSEIADIGIGYFAGKAAVYKYADADDDENETATKAAQKALADFVTRNNMYNVNMETTKYATICGYSGRLFYIDTDGNERVMPVAPYETIILYENEMTEPFAAVRYYKTLDINDVESYKAEYYDDTNIYYYAGQLGSLALVKYEPHMFDYCPLQGIPRNRELLGDAVKVLAEIDDYDKTVSDNSNDIEGNTNAHMVFQNVVIQDNEMAKARKSGAFTFNGMGADSKVYYLTKDVNDGFNEHHLDRLEDNIYRFSKTPNLHSEKFGNPSGISLKFKITGLESKCGMFEAKCIDADTYMYKLLASTFSKNRIPFNPLNAYTVYKRNFPMDVQNEAQTVQSLTNAGVPKQIAFEQLSFVDDVDYLMQLIEEEKEAIPSLFDNLPEDDETADNNPDGTGKEEGKEDDKGDKPQNVE